MGAVQKSTLHLTHLFTRLISRCTVRSPVTATTAITCSISMNSVIIIEAKIDSIIIDYSFKIEIPTLIDFQMGFSRPVLYVMTQPYLKSLETFFFNRTIDSFSSSLLFQCHTHTKKVKIRKETQHFFIFFRL